MYLSSLWIIFQVSLQCSYFVQEVPFEDIIALTVLTEPTETYWQVPSTLAQVNFFSELFPSFFCLHYVTTVNFPFARLDEFNLTLYV